MDSPIVAAGDTIVVWFSCGVASAVAAKKTIEKYGHMTNIRVVNNPIAEEHPDNMRFLRDVENWLGVPIESATNDKYPSCSCVDVWEQLQFMGRGYYAPCTVHLKKEARHQWEEKNHADWHVLGFSAEEKMRYDNFIWRSMSNVLPVLIESNICKSDCIMIVKDAGIQPPAIYRLGYPNANCIGCVKATSPTYWNHVRRTHPDVFRQRAKQSRALKARLVRVSGERIFLDELSSTITGRPMKNMYVECGIFCEDWE